MKGYPLPKAIPKRHSCFPIKPRPIPLPCSIVFSIRWELSSGVLRRLYDWRSQGLALAWADKSSNNTLSITKVSFQLRPKPIPTKLPNAFQISLIITSSFCATILYHHHLGNWDLCLMAFARVFQRVCFAQE